MQFSITVDDHVFHTEDPVVSGRQILQLAGRRPAPEFLVFFWGPDQEGAAQAIYYREARDFIEVARASGGDGDRAADPPRVARARPRMYCQPLPVAVKRQQPRIGGSMDLHNGPHRKLSTRGLLVGSAVGLPLAVACLLAACGDNPSSLSPPTPAPTPTPIPELQLLLSDGFDSGILSSEWVSGGMCQEHAGPPTPIPPAPDDNTIEIIDGRVWANANCNFIQTTRRFLPPLRIEAEIGTDNEGGDVAPCWNHYFEFYQGPQLRGPAGVLLFDFEGRDAIGLGPNCAGPDYSYAATGPNRGVATLTLSLSGVTFAFVNTDRARLVTPSGTISVSASAPRPIRLWLAGPSYVDNVRIYGLP